MVFQKRSDTGFIGCQIPTMPRFPRSARGKRSPPKKIKNNQMHPFDLLATVAGELLAKEESACSLYVTAKMSSPVSTIKQMQLDNGSPSESDVFDQGSSDEGCFVARFVSHAERGASSALPPLKSDISEKDGFAAESARSGLKCELLKLKTTGTLMNDNMGIHNLEDPIDLDTKASALVSSDSSVEILPIGNYRSARSSSHQLVRDGMELNVDRDDDENSSARTHNSAKYSKAYKPHCTVERRGRKMTTSNHWKADREAMNDGELWNGDEEIKPASCTRKLCYTRQRTQRSSFKRKKLLERFSFSAPDGGFCSQGVPDSLVEDDTKLDSSDPHADLNDAVNGRSCSTTGQRLSYESADHPVKLSIKSFRVPELFIEIPANATVGSLKRTVMETVTAVLSGGLRVGVLHQGKKIRDDNKTLLQAGISNKDKLDNLGFTLEPNPTSVPPPRNSHFCEPEPLSKILPHAVAAPDQVTSEPPLNASANCTESDHDSVHSATNPSSSIDEMYDNSKALVPILAVKSEALSVVPLRNSRRSEMVRRIRRPFSVSEVEALVHAVEKLGTGRWRDVKLRAFDNVKHRTYVDLKDKWKTLVHTARISPQQRRGEPVPQDLLDRVLSAHAYWGQQQAKSARPIEPCLLPA